MIQLEQLQPNAAVRGLVPDAMVVVVSVQWFGSQALELTYKTPAGKVANELLYRHDEPRLELAELGRPWGFDGDGATFRLVSEAWRIRLAHLFDPILAVHTSVVDPLPHQITAVYESMLPRQPLRFLLADDPGAGKTIMAGLLIKELIARGDLQRCLIVCPGSLAEQWQDELYRRFHLGTPLFPERIAYTVPYKLSEAEAHLYKAVTEYVREEFNRAEALQNDKRAGTVGFALTILQRRLASSPEAIYQSLRRRRERLDGRARELEVLQRGGQAVAVLAPSFHALDAEDVEDLDEAPDDEVEAAEAEILDQATAARSLAELKIEIETLKGLESLALAVRHGGIDTKWRELASLLGAIFTVVDTESRLAPLPGPEGTVTVPPPTPSPHQKLVLFTEHRDTLNYLRARITTLLGREEAVVLIHGGMSREERVKSQESKIVIRA
jgi:SNF2 family DNA or RNA helicase